MRRYLLYICMLLLSIAARAANVDDGYRIKNWIYEAQVHPDNTWTVTETMTVDFLEERHGIYRYIPRKFVKHHTTNGGDATYTYMSAISDVRVDGYNFKTEGSDDRQENLVIRIGDENTLLTGEHTYVIQYELRYPDDRYPSGDEFLHTVLGADCTTTIGRFWFRISFDEDLPEGFTVNPLSGSWGSEGNGLGVKVNIVRNAIFGELDDIAPFNGITLQANLPEGYWKEAWHVTPARAYIFLIIFLILLLFTLGYQLLNRRKRPLMVIEYSAPEGISSAEVGVIIDDSADLSDLTSLIVWFASKGYLKIRETQDGKKDGKQDDIELIRLKELPADAPDYQQKFWKVFFHGEKEQVALSDLGDRHEEIAAAMLALARHFTRKRSLTKTYWTAFLPGLLMLVAGVLTLSSSSSIENWHDSDLAFALLLWAGPIFLTILIRMALSSYDMIKGRVWKYSQHGIILLLMALSLLIFNVFFYDEHDYLLPVRLLNFIIAAGWIVALLSGRFMRDTDYRKEKMSLLLGFREFIKKAEMPMLKAQIDENPSYFYDILPYAMVFGLTKKWKEQFVNIDMPAPGWYECAENSPNISSLMVADRLSHQVTSAIHKAIEISSHDPGHTSTGSGGGGHFVGGGGGGGGVGSW